MSTVADDQRPVCQTYFSCTTQMTVPGRTSANSTAILLFWPVWVLHHSRVPLA